MKQKRTLKEFENLPDNHVWDFLPETEKKYKSKTYYGVFIEVTRPDTKQKEIWYTSKPNPFSTSTVYEKIM